MKKLALLVGSLLAVSAVASAKEMVPAPKAATEVKVVEKVVEVPVEKVVYKDRVVEKEVVKSVPFKFETSYKFDLYGGKKTGENWAWDNFSEVDRAGTLKTKASVEIAPKHEVRAEAEAKIAVIPHKVKVDETDHTKKVFKGTDGKYYEVGAEWDANSNQYKKNGAQAQSVDKTTDIWETGNSALSSVLVGYKYKYNKMASLDLSLRYGEHKELTELGVINPKVVLVTVAPKFDFAEYFFSNDNFKTKEASLTPYYSYAFEAVGTDNDGFHELGLKGKVEAEVPYGVTLTAESNLVKDYFEKSHNNAYYHVAVGDVKLTAVKDFDLYKNGKHELTFGNELSYKVGFNYNENAKKVYAMKDNKVNEFLGNRKLAYEPSLTYTYNINDYAKVYGKLAGELSMDAYKAKKVNNQANETETVRNWGFGSSVEAGLKVKM